MKSEYKELKLYKLVYTGHIYLSFSVPSLLVVVIQLNDDGGIFVDQNRINARNLQVIFVYIFWMSIESALTWVNSFNFNDSHLQTYPRVAGVSPIKS